jgi:hypothetical protein
MQQSLDAYKKKIVQLESSLIDGRHEFEYAELQEARSQREKLLAAIRRRREALGAEDRTELSRLMDDECTKLRMNALAVKKRIRDRLRQRKFELERLERSYRQSVNSEFRLVPSSSLSYRSDKICRSEAS